MASSPKLLGGAILAWTLIAWGGRVGLLAVGDDWSDRARIAGSVLVGLVATAALWLGASGRIARWVLYLFAIWTVVVWTRSMLVNWMGSGTIAFKLVHTVLALGFFGLAWWAVSFARGNLVSSPDETNGQQ